MARRKQLSDTRKAEVHNSQKVTMESRSKVRAVTENSLPAGLAQPALRALAGAGITRLDQLSSMREADLLALYGIGPKAIALLKAALKETGQSLLR